jgi:hypothetical protein
VCGGDKLRVLKDFFFLVSEVNLEPETLAPETYDFRPALELFKLGKQTIKIFKLFDTLTILSPQIIQATINSINQRIAFSQNTTISHHSVLRQSILSLQKVIIKLKAQFRIRRYAFALVKGEIHKVEAFGYVRDVVNVGLLFVLEGEDCVEDFEEVVEVFSFEVG